jgi:hypothetical protein
MTGGQKQALVFLALALVIAVALLWLPRHEDGAEGGPARVFPEIDVEEVSHISLQHGTAAPVAVVRTDEGWRITAPEPLVADTWRADSLASTLALLEAQAPIPGANPVDYGLVADQALHVEFGPASGSGISMLVGDAAPVGGTYIQVEGEVRVAEGLSLASLDTTVDALRARNLLQGEPSEAGFLAIELGDLRLEAVRRDDGWHDGSGRPLDSDGLDAWLRSLAGMRASGFGPPPGELVARGRIEVRAGEQPPEVLSVGQVEGAPDLWWQGAVQANPVTLDEGGPGLLDEGIRLLGTPWEPTPPLP